jgi:hypothetical protein
MRNSISKTIVAGLAALGLAGAVVLPTTPASAGWSGGSTWHGGGGGGGWHGGAWSGGNTWHGGSWGGGWHGGGWGNGWHGGWGGGLWHPGYWRGGVWYNGWWGPAVAAGIAAGALATYPDWGGDYGFGYNNGCWAYRATYDAYGRYLGENWVNIC